MLITLLLSLLLLLPPTVSAQQVLITVRHDSRAEAAMFNGFNRKNMGARRYQSTLSAKAVMKELSRRYHLQPLDKQWQIHSLDVYCAVFDLPAIVAQDKEKNSLRVQKLLEKIAADPQVESVQLMHNYALSTSSAGDKQLSDDVSESHFIDKENRYDDTYFARQYGSYTQAVERLHQQSTGKHVRVALVDTGADIKHADFRGASLTSRNVVNRNTQEFLTDRHGTAVLGVIAAVPGNSLGIVGLAPEADIDVVKACWHERGKSDFAQA